MDFIKERIGKLLDYLEKQIYPVSEPVTQFKMLRGEYSLEEISAADTDSWEDFDGRALWGGHREYYWFETRVVIPDEFDGACAVLEIRTGREGEWDATNPQFSAFVNGRRVQGLDVNHRELLLSERAKAGDVYRILLHAYTGDQNFRLVLDASLKVLDRKVENYYYNLKVPYDTARLLSQDDDAYITIIKALNESLNLLDLRKEGSPEFRESLEKADKYLTENFYDSCCDAESTPVICCVGHTHIDCAWLWTLSVTKDKAVRSFSTVLELMDRYPEYIFMSSQPQLYAYVKEKAPDVYERMKKRIDEGRWETEGGMWVEADCNLASGEALSRQFLYGKRFFRKEFGKDNEILWLPDVFGYSAALPQIMEKCGIRYFMTTKISWNETNMMPYDTFLWEGIDGSRTLTHFIPTRDYNKAAQENGTETEHFTTYNGYLNPSQMKGAWARYNNKELNREVLCSYGFGDGGGGPTRDMLENERRMSRGIPALPRTKQSTALAFFKKLEKDVTDSKYLPTWKGELYLEYHRGTYTTMARNKRMNRRAEFACQNAETWSLLDSLTGGPKYPAGKLYDNWIVLLRNQFHDILPGSGICEIYEDSKKEYEGLFEEVGELTQASLRRIADSVSTPVGSVVVFNPNSFEGQDIVCVRDMDCERFIAQDGTVLPAQRTADGVIFCAAGVPPKGYTTFAPDTSAKTEASSMSASAEGMENAFFRIRFNEKGQFESIYDKRAQRELLKEGTAGGVIMSYEDRPHNYDAWDINNYYTEKSWEVSDLSSLEVVEEGLVRATVRIERHYLDSVIEQYISIYRDIDRIDIRHEIDWKEHLIMLKEHYDFDVHTNEATFDIQYGNVKRDTTRNTSWDRARFEVCHHKWLDVAEDDYGISVLNDCKYGVSAEGGEIGLTMLKSALYPNPQADKEHHSFVYSIRPHTGSWKSAGTVQAAYSLNNPMKAVVTEATGSRSQSLSFFSIDAPNVVIESVKKAEDTEDIIVRLYECFNRRSEAVLTCFAEIASASECDIMEENDRALISDKNNVKLSFRPYEIKTVRIRLRPR